MKWYEYLIMIIAIGLVVLPIYLSLINKKKGNSCSSNCSYCSSREDCCKNFKKYIKDYKDEKGIN